MSSIRFIFYLPNLKSYRDRVLLMDRVAEKCDLGILVTSRCDLEVESLKLKSLKLHVLPRRKSYPGATMFAAAKVVAGLIREWDINIVHDTFGHLLPLFFRKGRFPDTKFVTSFYSLARWEVSHFHFKQYGFFKMLVYKELRQWLLRVVVEKILCLRADRILVQAPGLAERLRISQSISATKVSWIPNNAPPVQERTEKGSGVLLGGSIQLLFVGRFLISKGCDQLLALASHAKAEGHPVKVVVAGGWVDIDRTFLKNEIQKRGLQSDVVILPPQNEDQMLKLYQQSDWLVHCTRVDGSPRAVLEAMAAGLPVIASRHPGIQVIDPDEKTIVFIDENKFNNALTVLADPVKNTEQYLRRVHEGWALLKSGFSDEVIRERYLEFYGILLEMDS